MTIRKIAAITVALLAVVGTVVAIGAASADDDHAAAPADAGAGESEVPRGDEVVRIVDAYVAPDELVIEPAELFVGEAAAAAATADGAEVLDFYVRAHPDERATLPVASDVRVTIVDCTTACVEGVPSTYDELTLDADRSRLYRLTTDDGLVTGIDAIYLP